MRITRRKFGDIDISDPLLQILEVSLVRAACIVQPKINWQDTVLNTEVLSRCGSGMTDIAAMR